MRERALAATNVSSRDSAELVVMLQLPVECDLIEKILTDDADCSLDGLVEAVRAAARSFLAFRRECVTQLRDDLRRLVLLPSFGRHRKSHPHVGA
jgi:hypothetical protein